jgi:hypothetical protein
MNQLLISNTRSDILNFKFILSSSLGFGQVHQDFEFILGRPSEFLQVFMYVCVCVCVCVYIYIATLRCS